MACGARPLVDDPVALANNQKAIEHLHRSTAIDGLDLENLKTALVVVL